MKNIETIHETRERILEGHKVYASDLDAVTREAFDAGLISVARLLSAAADRIYARRIPDADRYLKLALTHLSR